MKSRELNVSDLIINILLHWRRILVFMLVGGMLWGGVKYITVKMTLTENTIEETENVNKEETENVNKEETENVNKEEIDVAKKLTDTQIKKIQDLVEGERVIWQEYANIINSSKETGHLDAERAQAMYYMWQIFYSESYILSGNELAYYKKLKNILNEEEKKSTVSEIINNSTEILNSSTDNVTEGVQPTPVYKYFFLGIFFGGAICIALTALQYILCKQLRNNDDIMMLYGIPRLGSISSDYKKKKLFGCVDNLIIRLGNRGRKIFSREESIKFTCATLKVLMKKKEISELYCVGGSFSDTCIDAYKHFESQLKDIDMNIIKIENPLYDAEEIEKLSAAQNVVLFEKANEALCDDIIQEVEMIEQQKISILGMIIVE